MEANQIVRLVACCLFLMIISFRPSGSQNHSILQKNHASCHRLSHYCIQAGTLNANGLAELAASAAHRVREAYLLVASRER